jgi:TetR/AcrR family transcriptional regulator, fatty acid metabolism regulator protein
MPPRAARTKSDTKKPAPRLTARAADVAADGSDRRKQILKAAVKVFAERGYHGCRISDVAEEAGVAYGLVYHYYGNKDGLLSSIFDTNWAVFGKAVDEIAAAPGTTRDKIAHIVDFVFQAYEMSPLVVKVLILEFGRSSRLGEALDHPTVGRVFEAITRLFKDAARRGELNPDIEPWAMTMIFVGAMETAIASFVLGGKRAREKPSLEAMKKSLVTTLLHGALREDG